jgi:GcrA cell cycle regulator
MVHLLDIVGDTMEWTNDRIDELRRLWGQGQTASRIAELLGGVTRNAVIGKAHRLGLRGRPSPIRREEGQPSAPRPARSTASATALADELTREASAPAVEASQPLPPLPAEAPPAPPAGKTARNGSKACSWPMGDPKQPGFHFCGDEAVPGRPYCAAHCSQAYQRKSEAAA